MHLIRNTESVCPTCWLPVPAVIKPEKDGVWMTKTCPVHGETRAMVERDPVFYTYVMGLRASQIYPGYFVDVTRRCNLRCTFCFQSLLKNDPAGEYTVEKILNECRLNVRNAPFIITGGEPTVRDDIVELLTEVRKISPVGAPPRMLSNGMKLTDRELYEAVLQQLWFPEERIFTLNLSLHLKETDTWRIIMEMLRADKIRIESALVVINSKESFLNAVALAHEYSDVIAAMRIHVGTALYADQKPATGADKIFVSDMLNWLEEAGENPKPFMPDHNKPTFFNVKAGGAGVRPMWLMLVSWYDKTNIDVIDIAVPPLYRAKTGQALNLVHWGIVNEGFDAGWIAGKRMPHPDTGLPSEPWEKELP